MQKRVNIQTGIVRFGFRMDQIKFFKICEKKKKRKEKERKTKGQQSKWQSYGILDMPMLLSSVPFNVKVRTLLQL